MAKPRKAALVDGYATLKAVRQTAKAHGQTETVPRAPSPVETDTSQSDFKKLGANVARTVIPTKHVVECYECGYKFQLHGRAGSTTCNKCRATLDLSDHTIANRWSGTLKTGGTVRVTADGVVQAGSIIANDFILEGTVQAGLVKAMRKLELRPGARFSEHNLNAADLLIAPGATIAFLEPAEYRDVEIAGTLRANLQASGLVTIRASGGFDGQLQAARLVVEEGGGLAADVEIQQP